MKKLLMGLLLIVMTTTYSLAEKREIIKTVFVNFNKSCTENMVNYISITDVNGTVLASKTVDIEVENIKRDTIINADKDGLFSLFFITSQGNIKTIYLQIDMA